MPTTLEKQSADEFGRTFFIIAQTSQLKGSRGRRRSFIRLWSALAAPCKHVNESALAPTVNMKTLNNVCGADTGLVALSILEVLSEEAGETAAVHRLFSFLD